jgi:hypothetical protein
MKKALLAVAALSCLGTAALAGPNADGTLIVALSEGTVYTPDNSGYCGSTTTESCDAAVVSASAGTNVVVLNVIAAFPANGRLSGLTFGVLYDGELSLVEWGACGNFELPDGTWPASGTGTAVTWSTAQVAQLIETYWFAAYSYYGNPTSLALIPHPGQGAFFADDDVPSNLDPIACLGAFGINGPGVLCCPPSEIRGACCFPDGSCAELTAANCDAGGGDYQGDGTACAGTVCVPVTGACCIGTDCIVDTQARCEALGGHYIGDGVPCVDPDPCATPTIDATWGVIKNSYR